MSRFDRPKAVRWDEAALDATLGKLTGKTMREAPHFKTRYGTALEVIDMHEAWKGREAARAVANLYPLVGLCRAAGLPDPVPEFVFHPHRKWRFDYAWPQEKVAVEIEGGIFAREGGRHNRGAGMKADMEKYNAAVILGWGVLRFIPEEMHHALPCLQTLFGAV